MMLVKLEKSTAMLGFLRQSGYWSLNAVCYDDMEVDARSS